MNMFWVFFHFYYYYGSESYQFSLINMVVMSLEHWQTVQIITLCIKHADTQAKNLKTCIVQYSQFVNKGI